MGPIATLTLFPPHSLDTSILAAVLVGVLLLALLTETFGWVFVGLVVPGYLASIFVINPEAAITVSVEALLTYLLAQLLSRGVSATGAWSEFFGRERFFLIVICSVLVRALSEVVLLPRIGAWLDTTYGTTFMVDRSLHSIGLVLVPLTANALWKLGLRRGAIQVGVPVALTWALLHFVLLPYTNLSFSSLELTYEDVAQRFLASPKAYIILLTTALLAARYNLRYGWDFNGILVAALVALTWLGPLKLLATVAEVLVLVLLARVLLASPGIRTLNLEGPRKTVLVFVLAFTLKWAIGWAIGGRVPGLKVTDLFGFGYLVPTLLAVKILQKQVTARVLLPTLHTSLAGVLVGSLIGFPLSLMEPKEAVASEATDRIAEVSAGLNDSPLGVMAMARATCRESDAGGERLRRRRWELRGWDAMWRRLDGWLKEGDSGELAQARETAGRLGLMLRRIDEGGGREAWALIERGGPVGWGAAVLFPGAPGPVLEVPRPLSEAPTAEAAAILCERVQCRAILVSGVDTVWAKISRGDPLVDDTTALRRAHAVLEDVPKVVVRADRTLSAGAPRLFAPPALASHAAALWPDAQQDPAATEDSLAMVEDGRTSVLRAHPEDLQALVTSGLPPPEQRTWAELVAKISSEPPVARHSVAELPVAELAVLADQVASPLMEGNVPWARAMAALLGMEISQVAGCEGGCWLLSETAQAQPRVGAHLLVRQSGDPLAFEVPTPWREAGTLPAALEFFGQANARALLFTDPAIDPPLWGAHAASPGIVRTSFQALHQAAQASLPDEGAVLQVRGASQRPGVDADVLITVGTPLLDDAERPQSILRLFEEGGALAHLGARVRFFDGGPDVAGLSLSTPQLSYARTFGGAKVATLWLSDALRGAFVAPRNLEEKLLATGIAQLPLQASRPVEVMLEGTIGAPRRPPSRAALVAYEELAAAARRFVSQQSVHDLLALQSVRTKGRVKTRVQLLRSEDHGLPFVLIEAREGRTVLRGAFFLNDSAPREQWAPVPVDNEAALMAALARRAPVYLEGEVEGAKR